MNKLAPISLTLAAAAALAGCSAPTLSPSSAMSASAGSAMSPSPTMTKDASPSAMQSGTMTPGAMMGSSYIGYADYQSHMSKYAGSKVVLFFHAPWCPDCKATDAALVSDPKKIPEGWTIVKVDYDSNTSLRQKYGVTMQHTFVQLNSDGTAASTWVAGSVDDLLAKLTS